MKTATSILLLVYQLEGTSERQLSSWIQVVFMKEFQRASVISLWYTIVVTIDLMRKLNQRTKN